MDTNRLNHTFAALKAESKTAFIPYITAGYPHLGWTVPLMHELVNAGASVIELGVPFSDPMADGPTIQRASECALANGTTFLKVVDCVREFRRQDTRTPVVLMGYLNSLEARGYDRYCQLAVDAGVDGVLTVDMPPESAAEYVSSLVKHNLAPIFLIAPTTRDDRIEKMVEYGQGYLYYVSLKGITGAGHLDLDPVQQRVSALKSKTQLPIAVGFGIKSRETCAQVGKIADGVVVGSALIELIEAHSKGTLDQCLSAVSEWVAPMVKSLS